MNKPLIFAIFTWLGICNFTFANWLEYQDLSLGGSDKLAILARLQAGDDYSNVAVIEFILQKAGFDYSNLIDKDLLFKQQMIVDYLKNTSVIKYVSADYETKKPDLDVETVGDAVLIAISGDDLISFIKDKAGFEDTSIRHRLLNNLVVLEHLLFLLGQDYNYSCKENLINKQVVFEKIQTSALLKTLHDYGYTKENLLLIVNNSSDLPSMKQDFSLLEHKKELSIDEKYFPKAIDDTSPLEYSEYYTPQEYDYLMHIINQNLPDLYVELNSCGEILEKPCLRQLQIEHGYKIEQKQENGQRVIYLPNMYADLLRNNKYYQLKTYLLVLLIREGFISRQDNKMLVLNIIKELAPPVYDMFLKTDERLEKHIIEFYQRDNFAVSCGLSGLPVLFYGSDFYLLPHNQQKAIVGHELGHYVLGHYNENKALNISFLHLTDKEIGPVMKSVNTFIASYTRVNELEADRFAVLNLGVPAEDMIDMLINLYTDTKNKHSSIGHDHPSIQSRVDQLEDLKRDLEQGRIKRQAVDWEKAMLACLDLANKTLAKKQASKKSKE